MKFKHIALCVLITVGFNSLAQKSEKKLSKIKESFTEGDYRKSLDRAEKFITKSAKSKKKDLKSLEDAYLYKAKNLEVLNRYQLLDASIDRYLKIVEENNGVNSTSFAKAEINVAEIFMEYGYALKSDSLLNHATILLKDSVSKLTQKEIRRIAYLQSKVMSLNGYYNEALDSLLNHYPGIRSEADVPYKTLKASLGKKAEKELTERRYLYGNWINSISKLYIQKGDLKKADSVINANKLWFRKNLKKDQLPFYENIYLTGLLLDYTNNKKGAISNLRTAYKIAKSENYKAQRFRLEIQESLLYTYLKNDIRSKSFKKGLKKFRKAIGKNYSKKSTNYLRFLSIHLQREILEKKIKGPEKKYTELLKSYYLPTYHPLRIQLLNHLGNLHIINNRYQETEKGLDDISQIIKRLNGENTPVYHLNQTLIANHLIEYSNDIVKAGKIYEQGFLGILESQLHPYHKIYVPTLNNLASYYELNDKFKEAEETLEKAKTITIEKFKKENTNYGAELQKIASLQINLGDYKKAADNLNKAVELLKNYNHKTIKDYAKTLDTYARLYMLRGMYDEAIENIKLSTKLHNRSKIGGAKVIVTNVDEIAKLYIQQGKYTETEKNLNYLLKDKEAFYGVDHRFLIPTLNQLAHLFVIKGDYAEAQKLLERSKTITQHVFGNNSTKICAALLVEGEIYTALGDYEKATEIIEKVIKITSSRLGENHIEIAAPLSKLASLGLYTNKELSLVEEELTKAKNIFYEKLGSKNPSYAQSLVDLANLQIVQEKYDFALANLNEANKIFINELGKENTVSSANVYISIADVYVKLNNFEKAKDNYNRAKKIYDKVLNDKHPNYVKILSKMSRMYYLMGNYKLAKANIDVVLENYSNYVSQYFSSLSESEKTKFWNMIKPDYEFYNSLALVLLKSEPEITRNLYNNALLTKSLLLSTSQKIRERILNSNDEELKNRYFEWIEKKELMANVSSFTIEELERDSLDPKKIASEVERLEKELSAKSEIFKQSHEKQKIDWKNIQQALKADEVAVEIVRFRYFKESFTDSIIYAALLVRPNNPVGPEIVVLHDGKQLENRHLKLYRNSIRYRIEDLQSYSNYWKPIKNRIGATKKIFLSPDGVFNQINIETLLSDNNQYVLDEDNIVLVSNTKDIYLDKIATSQPIGVNSVSIFGNPLFYDSENTRATLAQLPGTETESRELTSLLVEGGWDSKVYLSEQATEDNIKQLNNPRIFHIATHGFFMPDQESELKKGSEDRILLNPLFRSGLMLKGAGDLIKDNYGVSQINRESGILTAYEAMNLNFDNTDLVVLSACETGLGDVTVGEGVYGLQRAFLVAGAKSLVMSLFKVSDQATQKLMVDFYKKWLDSGNKRDSFILAKRELRKEYPDPIYWGSFVMVGLE